MTTVQKRFIIGINVAILFIFLYNTVLIFVRSIDGSGVSQTSEMKWLIFLALVMCYAVVWTCQGVGYIIYKHSKSHKRKKENHA